MSADRDQAFLMPPDVREWLPQPHVAWTVLDAVTQLDLSEFEAAYRADGRSRPAYDPGLMVALLLFAYCDGVRSSRQIEQHCERDVAFRVITGNLVPDHATVARFRRRHRVALAGLFTQVLRLLAEAGMVRVGLVALDGTRIKGNAAARRNATGDQLDDLIAAEQAAAGTDDRGDAAGECDRDARIGEQVAAMFSEAEAADAAEDATYGERRGDEPPQGLADRAQRLSRLQQAKARLDEQDTAAAGQPAPVAQDEPIPASVSEAETADPVEPAAEPAEDGQRRQHAPAQQVGSPSQRLVRLHAAKAWLQERAAAAQAAQDERIRRYERQRAAGSPPPGRPPTPRRPPAPTPPKSDRSERVNTTDPDSRSMLTRHGWVQGYNAQLVVGASQVIIAADLAASGDDSPALHPMLRRAREQLDRVGIADRMRACVADSGYGGKTNLSTPAEPILLIGTGSGRKTTDTGDPKHPAVATMASRLATPAGQALYRRRPWKIEPVFGQIKNRLGPVLHHRGRDAVSCEWQLIATSHNLLKYAQHQAATA